MIGQVPADPLANHELQRELSPGEELLWTGRPLTGLRLQASDALFIPFSLLWGGFAFFWEFSVWKVGAPAFFRLWGIPFVAVGIYLIIGRFIVDAIVRSRTLYALTDYRALILSGLFYRTVRSVDLRILAELGFSESRNGVGTITFGRPSPSTHRSGTRPAEFAFLEQARPVYQRVLAIQADLDVQR